MTTRLKLFRTYPAVQLPYAWTQVVNPGDWHSQGHVLIIATTKLDAVSLLTWSGLHDNQARSIMRKTHVVHDHQQDKETQALLASGAIDITRRGAYAWRSSLRGMPIARVTDTGLPIVATFTRTSDRSPHLTVTPT